VAASPVAYSRRLSSRIEAIQGVYVYWSCNGRDDLSRVRDLSISGLFLETPKPRVTVGSTTKLYFLVSEGSIRADAVIRYVLPGKGLGLKLTALPEEDRNRFTALIKRLRT
jgi:PilZ domain